jgi:hypothetical protein
VNDTHWRSPAGCSANSCIQIAPVADQIHFRGGTPVFYGKDGPVGYVYTRAEFTALAAAIKNGQYDDLCDPS